MWSVAGCEREDRRLDWTTDGFAEPIPDGGDAHTGGDAHDAGDARDLGDMDAVVPDLDGGMDGHDAPAPPPASDEIIPDEPWDTTHCNDRGWCWIHPSPFPHDVRKLRAIGGEVRGVVNNAVRESLQPIAWGEDGPTLLPLPAGDGANIADMTPTQDGWLAVDVDGRLRGYDRRDGWRVIDTLGGDQYTALHAASWARFVAVRQHGGGVINRNGNTWDRADLPGAAPSIHMWPNGDVWALSESGETSSRVPGYWRILERPEAHDGSDNVVFAPSPGSNCGGPIWGYSKSAGLHKWPQFSSSPEPGPSFRRLGSIEDLFCHRSGEVAAIDDRGLIRLVSDSSETTLDQFYNDVTVGVTKGDVTYLGGHDGKFVKITENETREVGQGARVGSPDFTALWVDAAERQVVLSDSQGLTWGYDNNWIDISERGYPGPERYLGPHTVDIWGENKPRFAATPYALFVFDDEHNYWDADRESDFGYDELVDISGDDDGRAWLVTTQQIFRFTNGGWVSVAPGERANSRFGKLHIAGREHAYVTDGRFVRRLQRDLGKWNFGRRYEPPCPEPVDVHGTEDGDLYVAGGNLCVARLTEGNWTTYDSPQGPSVRQFVERPGNGPPLLITSAGILKPTEDERIDSQFVADAVDAAYLPKHEAVWVLTTQGVVAKYY
jgi:hypothetical protein